MLEINWLSLKVIHSSTMIIRKWKSGGLGSFKLKDFVVEVDERALN